MSGLRLKKHMIFCLTSLLSITCLGLTPLIAQDANYWTHQYGTRSTLLGGAVIGSVLDLSGTYYNPGGVVLVDKPATIEAAKVFHYPGVKLSRSGREDIDISTASLGPAPSLLAGTLSVKGNGNHWVGYSFLTRHQVSTGLAGSFTSARDVLPAPGLEDLTNDIRLNIKLTESWFGLTWAYKLTETIGIGISPYLLVRTHAVNAQTLAEALTSGSKISLVLSGREFKYVNYRLLWKMGAAFDLDRITLGLTLTTPSIKIMGSGNTGFNTTIVGIDLNEDNIKDDYLAANYQEKLDANYKTPISLGLGLTYKFDNVRLYGSAEWFAGMARYDVISGEGFIIQSTEEAISFNITHELDSVLNFGVGIEYIFNPKFKTYASFTTDFSAISSDSDTNLSTSSWDIYHVMAGTDFILGDLSFTLGIGYAYGSRMARPVRGEEALVAKKFLEDMLSGLEYKYSSFKFILGFAF
ncbi:MAG: hypothetical protein JSV17_03475 [Candidatus Aminicenantes bacterium]|nr:MAG: hypothetical protein JSV17_03475 [Candidatus Aminicenantes bacterium]